MQRKSPRRRKKVERLTYESRGEQSKGSVGEQSKVSVGETNMKRENDDIETSFSSFGARVIALSLVFSVFASECALSYVMNVEPIVYALLVLWYFTLVTMGLFWIPNSKKYYAVCCINCVLLLGIPRLEAFRTLPPICGIIAAAALDTTKNEPLEKESKLWSAKNCFITPHDSAHSLMSLPRSFNLFLENLSNLRDSQPIKNLWEA